MLYVPSTYSNSKLLASVVKSSNTTLIVYVSTSSVPLTSSEPLYNEYFTSPKSLNFIPCGSCTVFSKLVSCNKYPRLLSLAFIVAL